MRILIIRQLFAALGICALVLAAIAPARAAPMTAAGGGMHGACPLCRPNSAVDHTIPKMPLCGMPACAAAALLARPPELPATLLLTSAEYRVGPGASLSGNEPKAEPPPPRTILAS